MKPHIDPSDIEASFITWYVKGAPKGGLFGPGEDTPHVLATYVRRKK